MATFSSPCVMEAMLAIQLLQWNGDRVHGQCSEAQCERQRPNSADDRKLDGEFRLARGDISPSQGLLLELCSTILSIWSSIAMI